ncbi:Arc family DNA-binding protein [Aeromonas sp. RU39B]
MSAELKGLLAKRAKENDRSMNSEIVQILKKALSDEGKRE